MEAKIKKIEDDAYNIECGGFDYHLRMEGIGGGEEMWLLDAFNSSIKNNDAAHVRSDDMWGSFQAALDFIMKDGWR